MRYCTFAKNVGLLFPESCYTEVVKFYTEPDTIGSASYRGWKTDVDRCRARSSRRLLRAEYGLLSPKREHCLRDPLPSIAQTRAVHRPRSMIGLVAPKCCFSRSARRRGSVAFTELISCIHPQVVAPLRWKCTRSLPFHSRLVLSIGELRELAAFSEERRRDA